LIGVTPMIIFNTGMLKDISTSYNVGSKYSFFVLLSISRVFKFGITMKKLEDRY